MNTGTQHFCLASAELYDPSSGTFALTGSMNAQRCGGVFAGFTATLLHNGKVLIVGGSGPSGFVAAAELYDPSAGTFTSTGSMHTARELFTATLLTNGTVLAAGGQNSNFVFPFLSSVELYNPATGKWTSTGSLNNGRYFHTANLLNNGQVLIAGGGAHLASAELYNPSRGTFSLTGNLNTGRTDHTAVLLTNGEVLAAGGYDGNGATSGTSPAPNCFTKLKKVRDCGRL